MIGAPIQRKGIRLARLPQQPLHDGPPPRIQRLVRLGRGYAHRACNVENLVVLEQAWVGGETSGDGLVGAGEQAEGMAAAEAVARGDDGVDAEGVTDEGEGLGEEGVCDFGAVGVEEFGDVEGRGADDVFWGRGAVEEVWGDGEVACAAEAVGEPERGVSGLLYSG